MSSRFLELFEEFVRELKRLNNTLAEDLPVTREQLKELNKNIKQLRIKQGGSE